MSNLFRAGALGLFALAAAPLFALSGSGDSAAGDLDTVVPTSGTASAPDSGIITGETISYAGASDASGVVRVELWAREDSAAWAFSTLVVTDGLGTGSFTYIPATTGTYHFDLVAEDTLGNRSAAPTGTGDDSTNFTTNVSEWSVFEP